MGDFLSLGSLKCSNIASHKGTRSTKVAMWTFFHRELWWVRGRTFKADVPLYSLYLYKRLFLKQHSATLCLLHLR